jgi:hypothetical protein
MTNAFVLAPSISLVEFIANRLSPDQRDYSRTLVLFPGKRPGYFLRKLLAERSRKAFIPPSIFSVDAFVDSILEHKPNIAVRDIDALDAVAILFDLHRSMPLRLGGTHFESLDAFLPLGTRLFAELEELKIAQCTPNLVREKIGGLSFGETHLLAEIYERFYAELQAKILRTRSMRYATAAETFTPEHVQEYQLILVGGFFALTAAEQSIFRKLKQIAETTFYFQKGPHLYAQLEKLNLAAEEMGEELEPAVHVYAAPDQHGEVFALARLIRDASVKSDEHTVVVLPVSTALNPVLQYALADLRDQEYNVSLGLSVRSTPLYTLLTLIMKVAEAAQNGKHHTPSYINLLRHPYVKNSVFRNQAEVTRILVHRIENEFARNSAGLFFDLTKFETKMGFFADTTAALSSQPEPITPEELQTHLRRLHGVFVRPFEKIESVGSLAERCVSVLQFVAAESTARLHPLFQPYAQTILESLDQLSRGLIASQSLASVDAYSRFLRTHLESAETHVAGTPLRGLQVLGTLETRGLKFKRVFWLDANDDLLPGRAQAESFLIPQSLRAALGLETIRDGERRAEYYFSVLTRSAEEVHLLYVDDGKRLRSRFIERFVWNAQQRQRSIGEEQIVARVDYKLSLRNEHPAPISKSESLVDELRTMRFSASALDTYLACGRKFYFQHLLRLHEKDELGEEVEQADVGNFVHDVLSELAKPALNRRLSEEDLNEGRVDEIIELQFTEHFGSQPPANVLLIREQASRRINEFITNYQIPMIRARSIIVRDVESQLQVPWRGNAFDVRVDRIEERNGVTHILDFKTGSNSRSKSVQLDKLDFNDRATWVRAIGSVQLPLYAILYSAISGKRVEEIFPAYVLLGNPKIDENVEQQLFSKRTADDDLRIEQFLDTLMKEVVDPQTPFFPPAKLEDACPKCPFTSICKTGWVVGWNPS